MSISPKDVLLTPEVMAYFTDGRSHLAPSQIDCVMGLESGKAHDVIVRAWAMDKATDLGGLASSVDWKWRR